MPRGLVRLGDYVVEWSTVVDAPVSAPMTRDELADYTRTEYGREGLRELPARLARLDAKGTSFRLYASAREATRDNRAGPNETRLGYDVLVAMVAKRRGER